MKGWLLPQAVTNVNKQWKVYLQTRWLFSNTWSQGDRNFLIARSFISRKMHCMLNKLLSNGVVLPVSFYHWSRYCTPLLSVEIGKCCVELTLFIRQNEIFKFWTAMHYYRYKWSFSLLLKEEMFIEIYCEVFSSRTLFWDHCLDSSSSGPTHRNLIL